MSAVVFEHVWKAYGDVSVLEHIDLEVASDSFVTLVGASGCGKTTFLRLLLDEPFGALDPGIRNDMHELVTALWRETGTTVFMVTHDLREAFKLGTRVLTFDKVRLDPHEPDAYGATITYDLAGYNRRVPEPEEAACDPALS